MATRVIVVRHGNTFSKGDTLLRVGKQTDLDLVEEEKGNRAGMYLKAHGYQVDHIYMGPLKRHIQTAEQMNRHLNVATSDTSIDERFNELDYGRHDGMPEKQVVEELGEEALKKWDQQATVPAQWVVDVEAIKQDWQDFLQEVASKHQEKDVLVVSSNGLIRFLPFVIDCEASQLELKVPTGGVVVIESQDQQTWQVVEWGIKP
ncbi:histidine phosphatase family protein [Vibrio sonorensis]|uniref:histidine phosphatase family protein n=1 Tax=Vibrio sonorensis TaxID=1004316 RepID=UPI0008D9A655|nr:histidine phosphatase family protein [Vibrio sonorensis]